MKLEYFSSSFGPVSFRKIGTGKRKILFFHGFPGSSRQVDLFQDHLEEFDLEVICFDRPGYNETKIVTTNSLDVTLSIADEIVTSRGWNQIDVFAASGGTPFGINYAAKHSENIAINKVRVICGLGCLHVPEVKKYFPFVSFLSLKALPFISGGFLQKVMSRKERNWNALIGFFLPASKPDLEIFKDQKTWRSLNQSFDEGLKQKALGPKQDSVVFLSHWLPPREKILFQIHFWHGDKDYVIAHQITQVMAPLFPNGGFTIIENEGHISLPVLRMREILKLI